MEKSCEWFSQGGCSWSRVRSNGEFGPDSYGYLRVASTMDSLRTFKATSFDSEQSIIILV